MRNSSGAWAVIAMLTVAAATVSCGPKPQSTPDTRAADEAAIRDADIAWSRTAETRDLEALVSYYTYDVIVLPPNMPVVVGKHAARELNRSMMATAGWSAKWQPEKVEAARSGDIGYARGTYVLTVTGPSGAPVTDKGKYLVIWKKQADGSWKVAVEAFNSDLPPAPVPPLPVKK